MLHTVPQEPHSISAGILAEASIQHSKVKAVFQRAVLDKLPLRYFWVFIYQAVREAEVQFRVGIFVGGAEEDDIA